MTMDSSDTYSDFLIGLAASLPDISETDSEPSTMSWGLTFDFLDDDELPEEFTTPMSGAAAPPTPLPSAPSASLNVTVLPRNTKVAVLCGCSGNFTWEVIPADYCNFDVKPHLVNTVDHTVTTYKLLGTFTEALWEDYNICTRQILNNNHLTDYCLAVYQQHKPSCFRNLTWYTVRSVKNILLFIEQFRFSGVSTAFCSCPKNTARADSPIFCFTCIYLHCEVKINALGEYRTALFLSKSGKW